MNLRNVTDIDVGEGLDAVVVVISIGLVLFGAICCLAQFRHCC